MTTTGGSMARATRLMGAQPGAGASTYADYGVRASAERPPVGDTVDFADVVRADLPEPDPVT
ncbi:hypothetical protein ACFVTY_32255 [Streptomyces sp. NPDC058067]|uniref:hypothetical protein n=1 Tax=Streptomyces sp. NPDC058067 TaxID=3346324 RepID=UPI0036E8F5DA